MDSRKAQNLDNSLTQKKSMSIFKTCWTPPTSGELFNRTPKNTPDFLQYRLEAMEAEKSRPDLPSDDDFQKQLVEVLHSMREPESEPGPDKRGMMGEPRAVPVRSNYRDEDSSDDIFFTCK